MVVLLMEISAPQRAYSFLKVATSEKKGKYDSTGVSSLEGVSIYLNNMQIQKEPDQSAHSVWSDLSQLLDINSQTAKCMFKLLGKCGMESRYLNISSIVPHKALLPECDEFFISQ